MKQSTKRHQSYVIPIVIVVLIGVFAALGSMWGNFATNNPPEFIKPLLPYSWYIFGVIVLLGIVVTIWQYLYQTNTNTPAPVTSSNKQSTSPPPSTTTNQTRSTSPYASCFICYSHYDQAFADKLYGDLQAKGVKCWYAPENLR